HLGRVAAHEGDEISAKMHEAERIDEARKERQANGDGDPRDHDASPPRPATGPPPGPPKGLNAKDMRIETIRILPDDQIQQSEAAGCNFFLTIFAADFSADCPAV